MATTKKSVARPAGKKAKLPTSGLPKTRAPKPSPKSERTFPERLVLQRWLMERLGFTSFEDVRDALGKPGQEGLMADGSMFRATQVLLGQARPPSALSDEDLRRHDESLRRVTQQIQGTREAPIVWKYFQYLALLFTEIYLDRYFVDPAGLLASLNDVVVRHNKAGSGRPIDALPLYTADDLRRLAFWCATGSGKTLILHANIRQYQHHLTKAGRAKEHNRVLLLVPKDLLAAQHLDELRRSGFQAERFARTRSSTMFRDAWTVDVMEITKLTDRDGKDTVNYAAFGGQNLVLIDESHQGLGTEDSVWKARRDALSAHGFAFEYSATFGQAVQAAKGDEMAREYARCIALDYSYREFYRDGYGKEYSILNLKEDPTEELRQRYIVGCLLSFYQQLRVYENDRDALSGFGFERPLWVFVGDSVSEVRKDGGRDVSDVVDIILALHRFVHEPEASRIHLAALLSGASSLQDPDGADVFAGSFTHLDGAGDDVIMLYRDMLARVFHTHAEGAAVHVVERRGGEGELTLNVSAGAVFGLVKVGEPVKVRKLCESQGRAFGLVVDPAVAASSVFDTLADRANEVHVLIGSRKFTEGWSSWRVSTLGLMNLGRTEGAQIVQLFGRGVRLRGWRGCLKRSAFLTDYEAPPRELPASLPAVETLGVFGLRANYMKDFDEHLRRENVPRPKRVKGGIEIPIAVQVPPDTTLYTMVTPDAADDRRAWPRLTLSLPDKDQWSTDYLREHPITLDLYPRLDVSRSEGLSPPGDALEKYRGRLTATHVALLDLDALTQALLKQRANQEWWNLSITRAGVHALLSRPDDWYELYLPKDLLAFTSIDRVALWQSIATDLLRRYCAKFYGRAMDVWSQPMMRYGQVTYEGASTDPNLRLAELSTTMNDSPTGWIVEMFENFAESKEWEGFWRKAAGGLASGTLAVDRKPPLDPPTAQILTFAGHLYKPLLFVNPKGSRCFRVQFWKAISHAS